MKRACIAVMAMMIMSPVFSQEDCELQYDGNNDGIITVVDVLGLLAEFGESCEPVVELDCESVNYQGYTYATAAIAGKCWFTENLRAESYQNGDPIETLTGSTSQDCGLYYSGVGLAGVYSETWTCSSDCSTPFDPCNDSDNVLNTFGRHYNAHAILDTRGLCPSGWHPSTDEEWLGLETQAGMSQAESETFGDRGVVSATFKTNEFWCDDNSGTNEFGFSALPAGSIFDDCGASTMAMGTGRWWSISEAGEGVFRILYAGNTAVGRWASSEFQNMYSVRCVRD